MSDYVKKKVIRYPIDKEIFKHYGIEDYEWDIVKKFKEIDPKFEELPCKGQIGFDDTYNSYDEENKYYIDYVLAYTYGADCGDFGISQLLTEEQKEKYKPMFEKFIPNIDTSKFRLVLFCYYNGCDCPDYYDVTPPITDDEEE